MFGITKLFKDFTGSEKSSGYFLIAATVVSLLLANLFVGESYAEFFHRKIGFETTYIHLNLAIDHWINDGLMAIFFFMVGLEIERELYIGELSSFKKASLPVAAAIGGMMIPCIIYLLFNYGTDTQQGYGIPMATDIAFALGVLSLIKRVPYGLKVFLTAFAIIDDLGAIIVIAIFYTGTLSLWYLAAAIGIFAVMIVMNRFRIHYVLPYILLGILMWYCMLQSGVHATISGVLTAFALPFGTGDNNSTSYSVQKLLHKPVAFIVLPIFALANTAIIVGNSWIDDLTTRNSLGVIVGLVAGKPIGVMLLTYLAVVSEISTLPDRVKWKHLIGTAALGGIGFTMSIFITLLAFDDPVHIYQSKMSILFSSIIASCIGLVILSIKPSVREKTEHRLR
jgi:Na+:H+ antiporter, NhaA family